MRQKFALVFFVLLMAGVLFGLRRYESVSAQSVPPSPADLITAVNQLRSNKGLPGLMVNDSLMKSAQNHSDFMAGNKALSYVGPGTKQPRDRAIEAGYGDGGTVFVFENIATSYRASTIDTLLQTVWSDSESLSKLLNPKVEDVGAAITEKDGSLYYTLDLAYAIGKKTAGGTPQPGGTDQPAEVIAATPGEDGSIVHSVQSGEVLWNIALAYKTTVDQLIALNNLDSKDPVIYAGQKLLIHPPFTPTVSPTVTLTPRPATRTSRPTFTARPTYPTAEPSFTPTPTPPPSILVNIFNRRNIGIGLIILCGIGLAVVGLTYLFRRSKAAS
jgi:LysM repeat protein